MVGKDQLKFWMGVLILAIAGSVAWGIKFPTYHLGSCRMGGDFGCIDLTEAIAGSIFIVSISILLALFPLFFLKENVYLAWRKFALIALPIIAFLIVLAPAQAPGAYISLGFDREVAAMTFSILFLAISWILIAIKAFSGRKSEKA